MGVYFHIPHNRQSQPQLLDIQKTTTTTAALENLTTLHTPAIAVVKI